MHLGRKDDALKVGALELRLELVTISRLLYVVQLIHKPLAPHVGRRHQLTRKAQGGGEGCGIVADCAPKTDSAGRTGARIHRQQHRGLQGLCKGSERT